MFFNIFNIFQLQLCSDHVFYYHNTTLHYHMPVHHLLFSRATTQLHTFF